MQGWFCVKIMQSWFCVKIMQGQVVLKSFVFIVESCLNLCWCFQVRSFAFHFYSQKLEQILIYRRRGNNNNTLSFSGLFIQIYSKIIANVNKYKTKEHIKAQRYCCRQWNNKAVHYKHTFFIWHSNVKLQLNCKNQPQYDSQLSI